MVQWVGPTFTHLTNFPIGEQETKRVIFILCSFSLQQHIVIIPELASSSSASNGKATPPSSSNHQDGEDKTNSELDHPSSILTNAGTSNCVTTANQSAQTRSVRFDRRRPQTLELRRESSRSYIGNCGEVDTYLL